MHRFLRRIAIGLVLLMGLASPVRTEEVLPEYLLKAQMIQALSRYVTWPTEDDKGKAFMAVVGYSPFEAYLDATFKDMKTSGRGSAICYAKNPALICDSKILFVCASEATVLPLILEKVKGQPILTVSDTPGFASKGVMVNISLKERRVAFEINLKAVKEAKLRISSHVLKLARIVDQ
jgi:hypothetical protein